MQTARVYKFAKITLYFEHLAKEKFFARSNITIPVCPEYGAVWNTGVQSIALIIIQINHLKLSVTVPNKY